jgi:cobalamin biosynthesis protein CobT
MVRAMQPQINAIQAAMRFRNNDRSSFNRGCTSGDLDEGSLHKLVLNENNPAIWERRELIGQPKVAVGLLVDESGSMGACRTGKQYIQAAKEVAVAMAAALEKIKGVKLMVVGHSGPDSSEYSCGTKKVKTSREVKARGKWSSDQLDMYEYFTVNHKNPWGIVHAINRGGNYDSFAMDYSVRKMIKDYQAFERKLLFVISDGEPSSSGGYGGEPAMKHMRQVCEWGRRRNVMVYGIGICNAYKPSEGEMMYGKGGFVILKDVMSSLTILAAFLRQVSTRQ